MKENDNDPNKIAADIENFLNQGGMDTFEIPIQEIERMQKKLNVQPIRPMPNIENYRPIPFDELEKMTPAPVEYVFHPYLPVQGLAFIYAASGIGKTLFTLNLAYAIAQGGSFLKYSCPKPRKVLYVDGEMRYNQIYSRLMQIKEKHGALDFPQNLCILTPDKLLPFRVLKIDDEVGQNVYKEIMMTYDFEVVVLDNISMLTCLDENKANEWQSVQDWLLHLRALGKSVIVIHHAGKDKNGYRGTSRMLDCMDLAISLQPVVDDSLEGDKAPGKQFKIVYTKNRSHEGDSMPFEVTLNNGFWTFSSMEQSEMHKVVDRIGWKINQRDIAKELNLSLSKVNRLVQKARKEGLLRE